MTKQEEEVVSFAATPKGFVREVREEEKEKETPKDEVKPEPSARKLGSSNRSFATVLGALSAMIIGGALATYSISFEYALYLHEKAVSYFPWSWLHVYTGTSAATLELFLIGIATSSAIIFVGMMLLSKKKKTVVPDRRRRSAETKPIKRSCCDCSGTSANRGPRDNGSKECLSG